MTVGIVGLGLIGGSFAKAYHKAGWTVLADDINDSVLSYAMLDGVVSGKLTAETIPSCDLILVCVFPQAAADYISENAPYFGEDTMVIDCCGTKRLVSEKAFLKAEEYGFCYVGGHPMAGTQYAGYQHARADLFQGAPMVIVPPRYDDITLLSSIKSLLAPAGFAHIAVTTADKHDEIIAFSSQLAHVVSSAYIKSPTALQHAGFSAGSYRDMTRVAHLNPEMWAELFLENGDNLSSEIAVLIDHLSAYKEAIDRQDKAYLIDLLDEGRRRKIEVDG